MSRWGFHLKRVIFALELYEILGILALSFLAVLFFRLAHKIDLVFGVTGYHWQILNNMVGIAQNLTTWLFTAAFLILAALYSRLYQSEHQGVRRFAVGVRATIAFFVVMAVYKSVLFYISILNPVDHDVVLKHIDQVLFFGRLPSQWLEPIIFRPLTWLLSASYMSWFGLLYLTIFLMLRRHPVAMQEYVFTAALTFYIGYLTYVFVPAIGPVFTVHYPEPIGGITHLLTLGQVVLARDCFPSLHTGLSIVMCVQVWRYRRNWCWLYIPAVTLIIFSTLYLRIHYGIDVIAGAALAMVTTQVAPLLVAKWNHLRAGIAAPALETAVQQTLETGGSVSELA
ncbi:MAG: phosphatase PAP2 family protein [Alicyclobacillus herbarius]|uniref:phosphatase PAP2 family protein n=1 Tax=Alicyclobacillus herbarius TaxID=122960 RepID=UPI002354728F|nr:phosphatase PAP2 family protein [Alicyclobacillus herbarius]MCL6631545.1 phosphatase PAP2 family protein [Alicyclobacillus herbarius]